jgi:WD40 repeat protein
MRRLTYLGVVLGGWLAVVGPTAAQAPPPGFVRQFGTDELRGDSHCSDVAISPDGKVAAIAGSKLRLWNLADRKLIAELTHPDTFSIHRLRFSPDGQLLGCLRGGGRVMIWDLEKAAPVLELSDAARRYHHLAFSRDGKLLATADDRGAFQLWELPSGKPVAQSDRHRQLALEANPKQKAETFRTSLLTLAFSPDGKHLVTAALDGPAVLWAVAPLKEVRRFDHLTRTSGGVFFTPDGRQLLGAGSRLVPGQGTWTGFVTWDVATGKVLATHREPRAWTFRMALAPDGQRLAFANDHRVYLWDVAAGKVTRELPHQDPWVMRFTPDGRRLFTVGWGIGLWDLGDGQELLSTKGHTSSLSALAFAPDGKTIASGGEDATIRLWDAATGRQLRVLQGHEFRVHSLAFAPDGKTLASAGHDKTVRLWDVATGQLVRTLQQPGTEKLAFRQVEYLQVAFSADGATLVVSNYNFGFLFFDAATGRLQKEWPGTDDRLGINSFLPFAWSADRRTIAACGGPDPGEDGKKVYSVVLWDVPAGQVRQRLGRFRNPVLVALSPDGKTVAASDHHQLTVWDATGQVLRTLDRPGGLPLFAPDGRTFAAGNRVYLNGLDQAPVDLPYPYAHVLAFSPDGDYLVIGHQGSAAFALWDLKQLRKK